MSETLQMRVYGPSTQEPILVYLPGLHGDWTLISSFRRALNSRVRFVETTYPRTLTWTLEDYAAAVEAGLAELGIKHGWLLGESFSSQVVWPMVGRRRFQVDGVILAGGFVRHPMRWGVRMAERITGAVSLKLLTKILFGYARVARFRYRRSPEVLAGLHEFMIRRTKEDKLAAQHRLHLIGQNDPCALARETGVPVYALTGLVDPLVPWLRVRRWLKRNCPALREYKIVAGADHNVLSTAPQVAADVIVGWMLGVSG